MGLKINKYEVDVEEWEDDILEKFHDLAKMRTYPKNFIGEVSIGGYTELV